jgi:4'-phosphopantetheinyl transferase
MADISINQAEIGLYIASGEATLSHLAEQHHLLDVEEHNRMARFRFVADRILFSAAHVLLRLALSRYAAVPPHAWRYLRSEHCKPRIDPATCPSAVPLHFSLSHTRGLVCCAISLVSEVGVDAEYHRLLPDMHTIAQHFFAPEEVEALAAHPS